jgi:hypothetical protein
MLKIKLTQDAYVASNGQDYHDFINENGSLTKEAVEFGIVFYEAHAIDENGNEYRISWKINDLDAYNTGDEDCCDWDNPSEIYSYADGKTVEAVIEW